MPEGQLLLCNVYRDTLMLSSVCLVKIAGEFGDPPGGFAQYLAGLPSSPGESYPSLVEVSVETTKYCI